MSSLLQYCLQLTLCAMLKGMLAEVMLVGV